VMLSVVGSVLGLFLGVAMGIDGWGCVFYFSKYRSTPERFG
jgi:hypothetical protein